MTKCESAKVRECESETLSPPRASCVLHGHNSRTNALTHSRTGFTLVEMMVVLVILGMMAGVAGLAARSLERTDASSERAAAIADARSRALRTRRPVTLTGRPATACGGWSRFPTAACAATARWGWTC
jgi:prepilin-type N-terminal cleavage/methylation domain-containing protein